MMITDTSWYHPEPGRCRLHLDLVPGDVVHAFAAGEVASLAPEYASPYLTDPECRGLWRMRSAQITDAPTDAPWVTRLMVDPLLPAPVGLAGFHGAPDDAGMVEVGYRVDPALRRRGYARCALETLLSVAEHHPAVRRLRATISPDNTASLALIGDYGFAERGEQWDEDDGREIIFEVPTSAAPSPEATR